MSDILANLNPAQQQAVTAPPGPTLILAGPGSGKTRVLTQRIAWLVADQDVPPWRIMAVTFTNKAAKEMRHRVEQFLGGSLKGIVLGTFHATCARILRREAEYLPIRSDYVIFDTADQRALMKHVIVEELGLDDKLTRPVAVLNAVSNAKNDRIGPEEYQPKMYRDEVIKRAYRLYQEGLVANNAVDFDDLLLYTVTLFENEPAVLGRYQNSYDHLLVDEFQDTNLTQYALVRQLTAKHERVFCVGDEDQSIYAWRGADYRNLLRLREDYPKLQTILLEQNYRSTGTIIEAAQAVIDQNPDRTPKNLFTENESGDPLTQHEAIDGEREADFVVDTIARLVADEGIEPGECAVMYRTNAQSRVIEESFVQANLPYRLVGATHFYGRKEIKDLIAYLRIVHNPEDSISLDRVINVPPRSIGKKTLAMLGAWAQEKELSRYEALRDLLADPEDNPFSKRARNALLGFITMLEGWRSVRDSLSPGDLFKLILDEIGYQAYINDNTPQGIDRWENVKELVNVAVEYDEHDLGTFLEEVALVSDIDTLKDETNAPTLLTLHAAKGLEFDAVFLVGLEEGLLPHSRSRDDRDAMAEERRLMYVGMTRARKRLYLCHASRRMVWGNYDYALPSSFLDEIPDELFDGGGMGGSSGQAYQQATRWSAPPRLKQDQPTQPTFKAGQRVLHPIFGEGIVIESKGVGDDQEVSIAFEAGGLKRLLASFANLELLDG